MNWLEIALCIVGGFVLLVIIALVFVVTAVRSQEKEIDHERVNRIE